MAVIDGRTVKWAEFVDEVTMGTTPTNPEMEAFPGELIDIDIQSGAEFDSYNILKGASDTDPLSCGKSVKTGETHKATITVKVSALTWIPYSLLAATTTTYAPGIVPHYVSIGIKSGNEYCVLKGSTLESAVFDIPDMKTSGTLTLTYICQDRSDWSGTDYTGTGSHATAPSADAYTMSDHSTVLYDGSSEGQFWDASVLFGGTANVSDSDACSGTAKTMTSLGSNIKKVNFYQSAIELPDGNYTMVCRAKDTTQPTNDFQMEPYNQSDASSLASELMTLTGEYAIHTLDFTIDSSCINSYGGISQVPGSIEKHSMTVMISLTP